MVKPSEVWTLEAELRSEIMNALRQRGIDPGEDYHFQIAEKKRNEVKIEFMALGLIEVGQTQHGHETWQLTPLGRTRLMQAAVKKGM